MNVNDLSTARGVGMTDIWGWEDPETGKEWVIIGRTEGVSFVDISTPSNPVWVGEMLKTASSPGSGWRDVKVYKDHAFVVADGAEAHGLATLWGSPPKGANDAMNAVCQFPATTEVMGLIYVGYPNGVVESPGRPTAQVNWL